MNEFIFLFLIADHKHLNSRYTIFLLCRKNATVFRDEVIVLEVLLYLLLELKWSASEWCVWIAVLQMFLQQPIQGEFAGSGSESQGPDRPAQQNTHPKPQHCASHSSHTQLREQPSSSSAQVHFTQHTHIDITPSQTD